MASPIDPDLTLAVSSRTTPPPAAPNDTKYRREYRYLYVRDVRANFETARANYEMSKAAVSTARANYEAAKTLINAVEKTSATSKRDSAKIRELFAKRDAATKRNAEASPNDAEEEKTQKKNKSEESPE
ncbi:hypothetical protein N7466_010870 [Penicillium verhagenii]|uniref:uncharacterized protein n=1 Tax=Penicillium verhagenii TaxID=1562060 RepID=UPI00254516B8|nr:uncharacterized protein N7466_010870 [Penicillium verhagenii]KAJ5917316.1 hypothetical protein N7466_010870 [Penicillium verhagenii]